MSPPSAKLTTEEIVASIKLGIGVSLPESYSFFFEDLPELHNFFSPSQLVTIEMLMGRIEDIEMQVYPEVRKSNDHDVFPSLLDKPQNPDWYTPETTKNMHKRIGKYVRIGIRSHPDLKRWFELGSAIGQHLNTLNEESWTNLESEYRKIFERHDDPSYFLEAIFNELEKYTFLKDNQTQSKTQIRDFARTLESENPERGTERRILTTARQVFPDLTEQDILVIRGILSLRSARQEQQFTAADILSELIKGQYERVPDNWEFVEEEKNKPNSLFKGHLSKMIKKGIILSRKYRLGPWSGLSN